MSTSTTPRRRRGSMLSTRRGRGKSFHDGDDELLATFLQGRAADLRARLTTFEAFVERDPDACPAGGWGATGETRGGHNAASWRTRYRVTRRAHIDARIAALERQARRRAGQAALAPAELEDAAVPGGRQDKYGNTAHDLRLLVTEWYARVSPAAPSAQRITRQELYPILAQLRPEHPSGSAWQTFYSSHTDAINAILQHLNAREPDAADARFRALAATLRTRGRLAALPARARAPEDVAEDDSDAAKVLKMHQRILWEKGQEATLAGLELHPERPRKPRREETSDEEEEDEASEQSSVERSSAEEEGAGEWEDVEEEDELMEDEDEGEDLDASADEGDAGEPAASYAPGGAGPTVSDDSSHEASQEHPAPALTAPAKPSTPARVPNPTPPSPALTSPARRTPRASLAVVEAARARSSPHAATPPAAETPRSRPRLRPREPETDEEDSQEAAVIAAALRKDARRVKRARN